MKKATLFFIIFLTCIASVPAVSVSAATTVPPASKCITTKTQATHASVTAQMEKDIAPYANTVSAASAIENYKQTMQTAWDAMQEPYCGFGSYGAASAIKSYSKNVVRARTTFLAAVKGKPATAVKTAALTAPSPAPAPEAKTQPRVQQGSVSRLRGLHRGMESDAVLQLQQLLIQALGANADRSIATGYFGPKTEKALIRFQIAHNIIPDETADGAGTIGPKTISALGKL